MNLNSLQVLGLVMIIFAFGAQVFIPGTIVYYSTASLGISIWPASTTPNSPLYVPAAQPAKCNIILAGLQLAEVSTVTVQISSWTGSTWTTVGTYPLIYTGTIVGGMLTYAYYFTTGAPGTLYALSYLAQTTDAGSLSGIGYIQTASLNGYFSLNGQNVSIASTLRVSDPTLSFQYTVTVATVYTNQITVYVNVLNGTTQIAQVTLTPQLVGSSYTISTGSYTLPAPGTYTLNGYVTYAGSTTQQMSIIAPWGVPSSTENMSFSDIYFLVGIFGVVFILVGARKKKET